MFKIKIETEGMIYEDEAKSIQELNRKVCKILNKISLEIAELTGESK